MLHCWSKAHVANCGVMARSFGRHHQRLTFVGHLYLSKACHAGSSLPWMKLWIKEVIAVVFSFLFFPLAIASSYTSGLAWIFAMGVFTFEGLQFHWIHPDVAGGDMHTMCVCMRHILNRSRTPSYLKYGMHHMKTLLPQHRSAWQAHHRTGLLCKPKHLTLTAVRLGCNFFEKTVQSTMTFSGCMNVRLAAKRDYVHALTQLADRISFPQSSYHDAH